MRKSGRRAGRLLAAALAAVMCLSLAPAPALAAAVSSGKSITMGVESPEPGLRRAGSVYEWSGGGARVSIRVCGVAVPEGSGEFDASGFDAGDGFWVAGAGGSGDAVVEMRVEMVRSGAERDAVAAEAGEKYDKVYDVTGLKYEFWLGGVRLDMSRCELSVSAGYEQDKVDEVVAGVLGEYGDEIPDGLSVNVSAYAAGASGGGITLVDSAEVSAVAAYGAESGCGVEYSMTMSSEDESEAEEGAAEAEEESSAEAEESTEEIEEEAPGEATDEGEVEEEWGGGEESGGIIDEGESGEEAAGDSGKKPGPGDFDGVEDLGNGAWIIVNEFGTWLVIGSGANPKYQVEYWAWLPVVNTNGKFDANGAVDVTAEKASLPVINTHGGNGAQLPTNANPMGTNCDRMAIVLDGNGSYYKEHPSVPVDERESVPVDMIPSFRRIYEDETYGYQEAPRAVYIDKVSSNLTRDSNYKLDQIWVLKDGADPAAGVNADTGEFNRDVLKDNWDIYEEAGKAGSHKYGEDPELDKILRKILVADLQQVNFVSDENNEKLKAQIEAQKNNDWDYADPNQWYYILVKDSTVVRLVYQPIMGDGAERTLSATLYDYWHTDGEASNRTGSESSKDGYGINNFGNNLGTLGAGGSVVPFTAFNDSMLAFGNGNTGISMNGHVVPGQDKVFINQSNSTSSGDKTFQGAAFGLASGLNEDGTIRYADGLLVPRLFNEPSDGLPATDGKKAYPDSKLTFKKAGDTYTLSSVAVTDFGVTLDEPDASGSVHPTYVTSGLDQFKYIRSSWRSSADARPRADIWSNSFWPLDGVNESTITKHGTTKYEGAIASGAVQMDDGKDHNCLFGMHYTVDFELTADYRGPLEYLFFGDDDMWVFLSKVDPDDPSRYADGKLVCDIGGVHSSVGEYVNLWDHIDMDGDSPVPQKYRLSFFYTERGLSGSCCYMQFTLPSVSQAYDSVVFERGGVGLTIEKQVGTIAEDGGSYVFDGDDEGDADELFAFVIAFSKDGKELDTRDYDYAYRKLGADGAEIRVDDDDVDKSRLLGPLRLRVDGTFEDAGDTGADTDQIYTGAFVSLKRGQKAVFDGLPEGTSYRVMEVVSSKYSPDVLVSGRLEFSDKTGDSASIDKDSTTLRPGRPSIDGVVEGQSYVTFVNRPVEGFELPKTGGSGTAVFLIPGAALACCAALALAAGKRRRTR